MNQVNYPAAKVDKIVEEFVHLIDDLNDIIRTNSSTSETSLNELRSTSNVYIYELEDQVNDLTLKNEALALQVNNLTLQVEQLTLKIIKSGFPSTGTTGAKPGCTI